MQRCSSDIAWCRGLRSQHRTIPGCFEFLTLASGCPALCTAQYLFELPSSLPKTSPYNHSKYICRSVPDSLSSIRHIAAMHDPISNWCCWESKSQCQKANAWLRQTQVERPLIGISGQNSIELVWDVVWTWWFPGLSWSFWVGAPLVTQMLCSTYCQSHHATDHDLKLSEQRWGLVCQQWKQHGRVCKSKSALHDWLQYMNYIGGCDFYSEAECVMLLGPMFLFEENIACSC